MIGKTLSHFKITAKLGEGGMGEVYRALDTKLDREVALKVLPVELAADSERLDRFKREAKALAALDDPGIVTIFSVEETDGIHFLTMGLVEGQTLAELIPAAGMSLDEFLEVAVPLTEAVGSAHRKGITHRDLKPSNVMVTNEGRVKVLDFGLAKSGFVDEGGGEDMPTEALTAEGRVLGTVAYMSPEQAEGKGVGPQSDVFSLGILLYEMTTGTRPFQADTTLGTLSAVLQAKPKPVAELNPDAPPGLVRIIARCLARQPAARYRDASELHEVLLGLQDSPGSTTSVVAQTGATTDERSGRRSGRVASRRTAVWLAATLVAVLAVVALWFFRSSPETGPDETPAAAETAVASVRPMIAVLPFQNLGSSQDEYFAIGMTEEIATRMASVSSIGVISTSSTRQYADTQKTPQEIGEELGAGYLVTGSILWARSEDGSSRIRITPQLVSTADSTQVWAQSYDRVLDDIFAIQAEIASQVVNQLGISLADSERATVAQLPTENLEAYDAYLRALAVPANGSDPASMLPRIEKLDRAVELDPDFALAWFMLTNSHSFLYTFGFDPSEERGRLALEAAQRVEEIVPGSALAAAAMGHYFYRVERDYDRALEDLTRAVELEPSSLSFSLRGAVFRRRADFESAVESYRASEALDPRFWARAYTLGISLQYLGRYEEAVSSFDRAIALNRDVPFPHHSKTQTLWSWGGHLAAARQALEALPITHGPVTDYQWFWQMVYEGDLRAALDRIQTSREEWLGMPIFLRPRELVTGQAHLWLGEQVLAEQQLELAVAKLQARLLDTPDSPKALSSLGVALAALGRRDEAIEAALRATEIVPLATDPWFAQVHIEDLAWVYTLLGDYDAALEQLEVLLEQPSRITIPYLKLDPRWAPLWDLSGFKELEKKYG